MEAIKASAYVTAASHGTDGIVAQYAFTQPSNSHFVVWRLNNNNGAPQTVDDGYIYGVPWNLNSNPPAISQTDTGVQQVTIIVKFNSQTVYTLVDFVSK
jgi:hypothetical protein